MLLGRYIIIILIVALQSASSQVVKKMVDGQWRKKMAELVRRAENSIVSIHTFVLDGEEKQCMVGSGFVYNRDGFIVTWRNVVEGGDSIVVNFTNGRSSGGRIVGFDRTAKVVLLKINCNDLLPVQMRESGELGEKSFVVILGNSLGVFPSVTLGTYMGKEKNGFIKLNAVVPPGNSGGVVLDEEGNAVGIFGGYASSGDDISKSEISTVGIAFPIDYLKSDLDRIIDDYKKSSGWVGLSVLDLESDTETFGVRVVGVVPDGPADRASISLGDTIIGFEERAVRSADELATWVRSVVPDRVVELKIKRGEGYIVKSVRIGRRPILKMGRR